MTAKFRDAQPHPVDVHVGVKVRQRRKDLDLSQQALADACGVSFQQVQKYERGANRISASMLVMIAAKLKTKPGYFLDDAPGAPDAPTLGDGYAEGLRIMSDTPGALDALRAYSSVDGAMRMSVLDVLRGLAVKAAGLRKVAAA